MELSRSRHRWRIDGEGEGRYNPRAPMIGHRRWSVASLLNERKWKLGPERQLMHREIVRYGFIPIFSIHDMRRTISARDFNEISFVNGGGLGRLFRSRVTRLESLSIPFVIIYSSDISVYFHSSSLRVISALRVLWQGGGGGERRIGEEEEEEEQVGCRSRVLPIIAISRPFWSRISLTSPTTSGLSIRIPFLQRSRLLLPCDSFKSKLLFAPVCTGKF